MSGYGQGTANKHNSLGATTDLQYGHPKIGGFSSMANEFESKGNSVNKLNLYQNA
jgi:hypothetical protein